MQSVLLLIVALLPAAWPITDGELTAGDEAVVGVISHDRVVCSGTLVAPRVVLTAAHCVVATSVATVLVGPDLAAGRTVPVIHTHAHAGLDVALLLLADAQAFAPVPLVAGGIDASFVGRELRVVGFGQTSATDGTSPRKRSGTATLASIEDDALELLPAPSLTCGGDSGGPALLIIEGVARLAGITSSGDRDCRQYTRSVRADRVAAFVSDFVAATADGAARLGARCHDDRHCATARCLFPDDAPRVGYCSAACARDVECGGSMTCVAERCVYAAPSPGAVGASCDAYADCDSLLCADGTCSVVCEGGGSCPSGLTCQAAVEPATDACLPAAAGCAVAPRGAARPRWWIVTLALALALALLRARAAASSAAAGRTGSCD